MTPCLGFLMATVLATAAGLAGLGENGQAACGLIGIALVLGIQEGMVR